MTSTDNGEIESTRGHLPRKVWAWYLGSLVVITGLSFLVASIAGTNALRVSMVLCGMLFLCIAIADWPRSMFLMIRNLRWFGLIREDFIVRWFMTVLGIWMLALGLFLPGS